MIWGTLVPAWLKRLVLGAGALALALLGAFGMGKREARRDAKAQAAKDHIKTRGKIDDALEKSKRSGASWHDRLRERDK